MSSRFLICDDKQARAEEWEALVLARQPEAEVRVLTGLELAKLVRTLIALEEEESDGVHEGSLGVDAQSLELANWADFIVLDSDLRPSGPDVAAVDVEEQREFILTLRTGFGDDVARQLRAFTSAKVLIVVNMFASRHRLTKVFDLTLTQDADSSGDIHVLQEELADESFWDARTTDRGQQFMPWYRQSPREVWEVVGRSERVTISLDESVLDFLGIDGERLTAAQLDPFERSGRMVTFRDFAESELGLAGNFLGQDDNQLGRVAKSAVRHWLERYVVAAQNVLVDAPHMVSRYWQLMGEKVNDPYAWNALTSMSWEEAEAGPWASALATAAKPFLSRPVFDDERSRQLLTQDPKLLANREPPEVGFAEDVSAFLRFADMANFATDVSGPYQRRWIKKLDGVGYVPAARLLL